MSNEAQLSEALAADLNAANLGRPHLPGKYSLSSVGNCMGNQILRRLDPRTIENWGNMAPGTAGHEYREQLYPSGSVIAKTFLVLGHEQIVALFNAAGVPVRISHADTVVLNLATQQLEVWDWKHTQTRLQYVTVLDDVYREQANTYAQRIREVFRLPYDPICRVVYISKDNWEDSKPFVFRSDAAAYEQTKLKIAAIDELVAHPEMLVSRWEDCAEGVNMWDHKKTPERKQCKYCKYQGRCLEMLGTAWNQKFATIDAYAAWVAQAKAGQQQLPMGVGK